jgi:hypothetical protein
MRRMRYQLVSVLGACGTNLIVKHFLLYVLSTLTICYHTYVPHIYANNLLPHTLTICKYLCCVVYTYVKKAKFDQLTKTLTSQKI